MGFLDEQLKEEEKPEPKKVFTGIKIEDSDRELMLNMMAKDIAKGIVNILKKYQEADISDMKEAFDRAYEMVNTKSLDEVLKNER